MGLPECYEKFYEAHADERGTEEAITLIKGRSKTDALLYANCHNTMHVLGRSAYQEYGSLPKAFARADYFCWSGYYHGVVEGALRGVREKDITRDTLFNLCSTSVAMPTQSFDQFNCMHGIGHALMYITKNELPHSLIRCNDLPDEWSTQHCATGVFMENSLADGKAHRSAYLPTTDLHYPCTITEKKFGEACYIVQSSLILKKLNGDFAKAFDFCLTITELGYRTQCARGLGKEAAQTAFYDSAVAAAICAEAPPELISNCFFGAIGDISGQLRDNTVGETFCAQVSTALRPSCLAIIAESGVQIPTE